jgi:predicted ArsR family transcriptional regulator
MKSTREKILRTLLTYPGTTIKQLSEVVGINGISIRHHLNALEAEGLITSSEERHGVGRPHLVYTLTEKGIEEFPTGYVTLTKRLLTELKLNFPDDAIGEIFEGIAEKIADSEKNKYQGKPLSERVKALIPILKKEGFVIETQENSKVFTLTSLNCPYYKIAIEHPEICLIDQILISKIVSVNVVKKTCINAGDDRCTFLVG